MKNCGQLCPWNTLYGCKKPENEPCILTNMPCENFEQKPMTNADRIRSLSDEELAKHNVREGYEYTVDYDYDDNPVGDYTPCYRTSDGSIFWDEDSAVEYELAWLKQPYGGAEK